MTARALDKIEVPIEGIIPIFPKEKILELDEYWVNNALVTVTEKKEFIPHTQMLSIIKEYNETDQLKLAEQICTVPAETGLGDITWNNLNMSPEGKMLILDTEPLYGELNTDREGIGFGRSVRNQKH